MSRAIIILLLNTIGLIAIVAWVVSQLKDFSKLTSSAFFTWKRFRYSIILFHIVGAPILFLNYTPLLSYIRINLLAVSDSTYQLYCWLIAFIVSMIWLRYILKLDIYDKEKWVHIASTFFLSVVFVHGCDFLYPLFHLLGFSLNGEVVNDFIYCVFGIGLIEETVKFIPFLIMLKFTKAINEPYDYLLYASVSALGFAFAENAMYLNNYGIDIIGARAFFAAVAHMTFCSTVTYGLLLKKYRFIKVPSVLMFLIFFGIAMFVHGFYDFWLINDYVSDYEGVTIIFFLITIHLWFTMKNNAINISNYYDEKIVLKNDSLKHYLVISLTSLFMFSYVYVAITANINQANSFFWKSALVYGYVIFYLIMSFSRFKIVKGFFKPLDVPFYFIVPQLYKRKK
jgi:RsiW-degrading membrane proteinase PrsW (M82 family)